MNPLPSLRRVQALSCAAFLVIARLFPAHAEPAGTATGHWEGEISLPGTKLAIQVDLSETGGAWGGSIDIPAQGLRGFKLADVKVNGESVGFALPGIPGDPAFSGKLKANGKNLGGEFKQGGLTLPFMLTRQEAAKPARAVPGTGLAGFWQGTLRPSPLMELRLALEIIQSEGGKLRGVMTSLDQGGTPIPVTTVNDSSGKVHLDAATIGGSFEGAFKPDGSELSGDWRQGGGQLPLVFKRVGKAAKLKRPQEPEKPYPYRAEDVMVENKKANLKLAGTLTLPQGAGHYPAVVLITGSGAQDRDEALMGHRPFLVLADHLTRQGFAVLRCDDRGTGKSTGNFAIATDTDFVEDALSCVAWLKGRREIDPKRIGLVGHSEGGVVAPLAAVKQPGDIAFIVMLAGVGVPMEELLIRQGIDMGRVMGQSEADAGLNAITQRESFELIKKATSGEQVEKIIREAAARQIQKLTPEQCMAPGVTEDVIAGQAKAAAAPWFRQLLAYDPRPTLMRVKCPVLAVNGEKDLQVAAKENLAAIRGALHAGGNEDFKIVEFPGLNHLFQTCTSGAVSEYGQIEETFSPMALKVVGEWLRERAGQ